MNCFKSQKGFTMIEVMVVAVIIGVMAAVAIPSIRAWLPRQQIRSVKRDIVSSMQLGRMRAIGSGSNFHIDFDHDNAGGANAPFFTCYLDTDNDGANGELNNGVGDNEYLASQESFPETDSGIPVIGIPAHVSYGVDAGVVAALNSSPVGDGVAIDADRLEFHPDGRAELNSDNNWPTVYIRSDRGEHFAIQVNMLGRVNVLKWNGAAWQG
jgi:prepilin-type N-terminal cleavage/methylation domain-containing protein